jgi:hypothetical protein
MNFVALLGAIMGDINIHEPIEVQATERHMDEPGNNIDDQILPYFMAVIPDEVKAGMYLFFSIQLLWG